MNKHSASRRSKHLVSLSVFLFLLFATALSFGANRLVVQDSSGNNNFTVQDTGAVFTNSTIGIGVTNSSQSLSVAGNVGATFSGAYVGAFGTSDASHAWFSRNGFYNATDGSWERFDTTSYTVLDQQAGKSTIGQYQIYTAAPAANPISNWVKQFSVDAATGNTFINGNEGVGTTTPTDKIDVNGSAIRVEQSVTPASSTATCNQGEIEWDANYVYVCVAANTWKRASLSSW